MYRLIQWFQPLLCACLKANYLTIYYPSNYLETYYSSNCRVIIVKYNIYIFNKKQQIINLEKCIILHV